MLCSVLYYSSTKDYQKFLHQRLDYHKWNINLDYIVYMHTYTASQVMGVYVDEICLMCMFKQGRVRLEETTRQQFKNNFSMPLSTRPFPSPPSTSEQYN